MENSDDDRGSMGREWGCFFAACAGAVLYAGLAIYAVSRLWVRCEELFRCVNHYFILLSIIMKMNTEKEPVNLPNKELTATEGK